MPTKCPTCHAENPDAKPFCADCGTKLGISPDSPPSVTKTLDLPTQGLVKGSVFADRYEIIEQLGEGGMGQVYRARDTQIEEDIAIKILRPEIALDKRILERFRNELKFARRITHKSVCRMHDISVSDGTTYITMEYVEGEDLKSVIQRKGKLGLGQAMGVVMQIADGLCEAHNLGIVHRDLKPQNIMIDPEGNAKIMDFGIARSTQAEGVTQEGSIIGTPEYMSPEQVEGRTVDQRSDIYSLGVILYEMLTGQVPFSGETVLDIALKHKTQEPENPKQFNKKIPDDLADLILRCMAKDSQKRFQSADELLKSLLSIQETLPESERNAMRIVPRLPGAKAVSSSLKKVLISAAAGAAVVILGIIAWRLLFSPTPAVAAGRPSIAVLNIKNNTGDPEFDQWMDILPEMLAYDLMQSKFISVVNRVRVYSFLNRKDLIEARNYSLEDLKELADEVRATHFIQGFFTKAGDNFKLSLSLQETKDMELLDAFDSSIWAQENFSRMVDELTEKIKPHLGLTDEDIKNDFDENIAETATPIIQAYNFYVQAQKAWGMFNQDEAVNLLDRALVLDPDFSMAHWIKGMILINKGEGGKGLNSLRLAYEAIQERPAAKRDRLTIEAMYYFLVIRDLEIGEKLLKELVESYPDDYWGNHYLGVIYMHSYEDREKALRHYEVLLRSGEAKIHEYHRLSTIYDGWQQYQKAREVLNLGLEQLGENFFLRLYLADSYRLEGKYAKSLEELDKTYLLDPLHAVNHIRKGIVYMYMEDFRAAEEEFSKLLERENLKDRTSARESLIFLYKHQGRFNDVIEQINLAEEKPNQMNIFGSALVDVHMSRENWEEAFKVYKELFPELSIGHVVWAHVAAFLMSKLNQWDEAQAIVDKMKDSYLSETSRIYWYNVGRRCLLDLQGRLEMERDNYVQAIEYLEQAKKLIPGFHDRWHAWHVEALARAYLESGQLEKARENYTLITTMKGGRDEWGEIYAKAFYRIGIIAEELGDKREARKQYTRFLELWKDADPGLPEVEDAKKRLTELNN